MFDPRASDMGVPGGSSMSCVMCQRVLTDWEVGNYAQLGGRCMDCCQKSHQQQQDSCVACGQLIAPLDSQVVRCTACYRRTHAQCDVPALAILRSWTPGQPQPMYVCMQCRLALTQRGGPAGLGPPAHAQPTVQRRRSQQHDDEHAMYASDGEGGLHGALSGGLDDGGMGPYGQKDEAGGAYSEKDSQYETALSPREAARKLKDLANLKSKLDGIKLRRGRTAFNIFQDEHSRMRKSHRYGMGDNVTPQMLSDKWRKMSADERAVYEDQAIAETQQYQRDKAQHWRLQQQYEDLRQECIQYGLLGEHEDADMSLVDYTMRANSVGFKRERDSPSEEISDGGRSKRRAPSGAPSGAHSRGTSAEEGYAEEEQEDADSGPRDPYAVEYDEFGDVTVLPVSCNHRRGVFLPQQMRALCLCNNCVVRHPRGRDMSCTQFEQHCGMGGAKKWKASLRVQPGCVPEVPRGAVPMQLGKWLELRGMEVGRKRPGDGSQANGTHDRPSHGTRLSSGAITLLDARSKGVAPLTAPVVKQFPTRTAAPRANSKAVRADSRTDNPMPAPSGLAPSGKATPLAGDPAPDAGATGASVPEMPRRVPATALLPENPWMAVASGRYKPVKVRWAGDRCCVCDGDVDYDHDQLISCDRCNILVHQMCYGIPTRPDPNELWLCRACEYMEEQEGGFGGTVGAPVPAPQCCLCPITGGALKPSTVPGLWAHSACSQWLGNELSVMNFATMEPVDGIHLIQKERWELKCHICKQGMGAKLQCLHCYLAFHPLCARLAGLDMQVQEVEGEGAPRMATFCHRHGNCKPHMSGVQMALDRASAAFMTRRELINGQFWDPPPAAELPVCLMGCARAQMLQPWSRKNHGTGTGYSTTEGFWLPPRPPTPPQPEPKPSAPTPPPTAPTALKPLPKSKLAGVKTSAKSQPTSSTPPPKVDLMPMPNGVPDKVEVMCNGRGPATFLVRQQRVLHEDQEISPSRFEQLCGKGDAKKWKSSLHALDAHGAPCMSMGDWLLKHGLDKSMMGKLLVNWNAYETYETWRIAKEDEEGAEGDRPPVFDSQTETPEHPSEAATAQKHANGAEPEQQGTATNGEQTIGIDISQLPTEAADGEQLVLEGEGALELPDGAMMDFSNLPEGRSSAPLQMPNDESPNYLNMPMLGDHGEGPHLDPGAPTLDGGTSGLLEDTSMPFPVADSVTADRPASHEALGPRDPAGGPHEEPPAGRQTVPIRRDGVCEDNLRPEQRVGWALRIYWPTDDDWYQANVLEYDARNQRHLVHYPIDAEAEWIDLGAESKSGRVQWLPKVEPQFWPPVPRAPHPPFEQRVEAKLAPRVLVTTSHAAAADGLSIAHESSAGPAHEIQPSKQQPLHAGSQPQQGMNGFLELQPRQNGAAESPMQIREVAAPRVTESTAHEQEEASGQQRGWAGDLGGARVRSSVSPGTIGSLGRDHDDASVADASDGPATHEQSIGWRVGVWWADDQVYYFGRVREAINGTPDGAPEGTPAGPHLRVLYDDGVAEWVNVATEKVLWKQAPRDSCQEQAQAIPQDTTDPAIAAAAEAAALERKVPMASQPMESYAQEAPQALHQRPDIPDQVEVICGGQRGVYDVAGGYCLLSPSGRRVTPTEFERLGGKGSSKKWKSSIRVHLGGGMAGATMAEWLVESGIEQPAAPRQRAGGSQSAAAHSAAAHQWSTRTAATGGSGRALGSSGVHGGDGRHALPRPRAPHPPMCTCIICKQARKRMGLSADAPLPTPKPPPGGPTVLPPRPPQPTSHPSHAQTTKAPLLHFTPSATPAYVPAPHPPADPRPPTALPAPPKQQDDAAAPDAEAQGVSHAQFGYVVYPRQSDPAAEAHRLPSYNYVPRSSDNKRKGDNLFIPIVPDPLARTAAPQARWGKHAYVYMHPQFARGPARHCIAPGTVHCQAWDPLDWARKQGLPSTLALDSIDGGGVGPDVRRHAESHMRGFARRHAPNVPTEGQPEDAIQKPGDAATKQAMSPREAGAVGPPAAETATIAKDHMEGDVAGSAQKPDDGYVKSEAGAEESAAATATPGGLSGEVAMLPDDAAGGQDNGTRKLRSGDRNEKSARGGDDSDGSDDETDDETDEELEAKVDELLEAQETRIKSRVPLTVAQKVRECVETEKARVMFGKSGIHGWGLVARTDMPQDSMVLEYRAQVVRRIVADKREEEYKRKGIECYFFAPNDEIVMDSTYEGSMARFTNHCCMPNMYTRVLEMDGELRLIWMARTDIKAGQELTFSYRFKEEEGEHKVPCHCGAPNCRGFLN